MSALVLVSTVAAALALAAAVWLALALVRTRRQLADLHRRIQRLQDTPPPTPTAELALQPRPYEPPPLILPSTDEVLRAALHRPLVRAVTVSYGLRRALRPESRDRIRGLMRREFHRRRKMRQRAGRRTARMTHMERSS